MKKPMISIILVNLNGRSLLPDCLDALLKQSFPSEKMEIILVDNGSSDDSVTFIRENYPAVVVIEAGKNLGFAGGNNVGAETARGDYLAFINNDAISDTNWLSAAMNAFYQQPDIDCAACKLLNADGSAIDYVETSLNLFGRAFQLGENLPVELNSRDTPIETFAPCGGAMVIRRQVFLDVGGFDDDYIAYFEDVDLGWRLWVQGYKTWFVPESFVYHKKHQTGTSFANDQRYALSEMNALRTLIKNLEDENLWQTLAFAVMASVKRALNQADVQRESYRFGSKRLTPVTDDDTPPSEAMARVAVSLLVAMDAVADELPQLMEKRQRIQSARQRSDAEIFEQFPLQFYNPLFPWRDFQISQQNMVAAMGFPTALRPARGNNLLIIAPKADEEPMTALDIRVWKMAHTLSETMDVTVATMHLPARSDTPFRMTQFHADDDYVDLKPLLDTTDVILAMGPLVSQIDRLQRAGKPVIIDLSASFELDELAKKGTDQKTWLTVDIVNRHSMILQGVVGDFFICATERQRDFWMGALLAAGRVNSQTYSQDASLRQLIDVVPMGIPAEPPRSGTVLKGIHPLIGRDDTLLLWNSGFEPWSDPILLLDALAEVVKTRKDVKLFFAVGKHVEESPISGTLILEEIISHAEGLGLMNTFVFFGERIPYSKRGAFLLEADAVVNICCPGIETEFATQTPILECIWAGVSLIATAGFPLSDLAEQSKLGQIIPPGDAGALATAILNIVNAPNHREHVRQAADSLRAGFLWQETVKPIMQFMAHAQFAADALRAARRAAEERQISNIIAERNRLQEHLAAVRQGRVMKFLNTLDNFWGRGAK